MLPIYIQHHRVVPYPCVSFSLLHGKNSISQQHHYIICPILYTYKTVSKLTPIPLLIISPKSRVFYSSICSYTPIKSVKVGAPDSWFQFRSSSRRIGLSPTSVSSLRGVGDGTDNWLCHSCDEASVKIPILWDLESCWVGEQVEVLGGWLGWRRQDHCTPSHISCPMYLIYLDCFSVVSSYNTLVIYLIDKLFSQVLWAILANDQTQEVVLGSLNL